MITVHGKKLAEVTRADLDALRRPFPATVLDVGAGDGAWAYRYAKAHPDQFVIALDPVAENLREYSTRAERKLPRGGLPNVLYVVASVEHMPDELQGVAGDIYVTLPWGSLMRGIVLAEDAILEGLASLARPGATVRIVLNTRIFDDPIPIEAQDLPEVTPDYVRETLAPEYASHGLAITAARWMDAAEVTAIGTTWAKRLSHRSPPRSVLIEARIEPRRD